MRTTRWTRSGGSAALIFRDFTRRRSVGVRKIAIPMAITGIAVSSYHVLIERYPQLESSVCDINVPCNQIWFQEFGFITIPVMALCGFAFIATVLALPLAHRSPA